MPLPVTYTHECHSPFFVFAIAVDLGTITSTTDPVTWAAGYVRDPSVQYTTGSGETQNRRPYFFSQYSDISSAVSPFFPCRILHMVLTVLSTDRCVHD